MDLIDFHAHCLDPQLIPAEFWRMRAQGISARMNHDVDVERMALKICDNTRDADGDLLSGDLRDAGFDHAVLVGLDWEMLGTPTPSTSPRYQLRWAEGVVERHPGLFSFLVGLDPRRPDAREILDEALAMPWVAGLKVYPPMGFPADSDAAAQLYEGVVQAGKIVMAHTGGQSYPFDVRYAMLEQYASVQRRFPELQLVLGHAGYPLYADPAIEVARAHRTSYLEVSGWHRLIGKDDDRLESFLAKACDELGPHRVLFGSDHMSGRRSSGANSKIGLWRKRFEDILRAHGHDPADSYAGAAKLVGR